MCGIAGVISKRPLVPADRDSLEKMLDHMSYRGPDNKGISQEDHIILGHRRLSIIDLSKEGDQPFHSADGQLSIVFNGEIFNYQELRAELSAKGYRFRSQTDTEVILAAYTHFGAEKFCTRLRGMFAFVLYDRTRKQMIFARDRLGKKPLFLYEDAGVIAFSSEIKFFHLIPSARLDINESALLNYLCLQYVPGSETIYSTVKQVAPGEMVILDLDSHRQRSSEFWDMYSFSGQSPRQPDLDEIDNLIRESVKYRLIANVDVGLLLSGGIDSSLLASYMHELAGKNVKAFNVGFRNKKFDESEYARTVAASLDMELISLELDDITPQDFSNSVFHADQPFGDSAAIPTYLIAKAIGQHVKVVLSGEGADELFHGYDHYNYEKFYYAAGLLPRKILQRLLEAASVLKNEKLGKLRRKLQSLNTFSHDTGASRWTSIISPELARTFLDTNITQSYERKFSQSLHRFSESTSLVHASLMLDLKTWLPDDLLVKTDRMMMAHSVEARTPFLDHKLVETVLGSSRFFSEPLFRNKNYLRRLLAKRLPNQSAKLISRRPKQGFETPKETWVKGNLKELSDHLFSDQVLAGIPWIHSGKVADLWSAYKANSAGVNKRLVWNFFCFFEWYRQHQEGFGLSR